MRDRRTEGRGLRAEAEAFPPQPYSKRPLFVMEALHQFPSTFFLYGEPFYARQRFGWDAGQIALSQGIVGLCVIVGAFTGGQIAHRARPRSAMTLSLFGCLVSMVLGGIGAARGGSSETLLAALGLLSGSQALFWPALEASLMDGEPPKRVQDFVAHFNLNWSLAAATAFLVATPLMDAFGLKVLFVLPLLCYLTNLLLLYRLPNPPTPFPDTLTAFAGKGERVGDWEGENEMLSLCNEDARQHDKENAGAEEAIEIPGENDFIKRRKLPISPFPVSEANAAGKGVGGIGERERAAFRWLGWLGNPLGFVAINVLVAYNPTLQTRLGLSFAAASVWCSLWFYVRALAFEILRRWTWWHYRWRFLCMGLGLAMVSFAGIVLAPNLGVLLAAQAAFGLATGLLYQSSLYYSMAGSAAQGEHGGFHETFVGLGLLLGPMLAYGGARLAPGAPWLSVGLVLALMALGLAALMTIGLRTLRRFR